MIYGDYDEMPRTPLLVVTRYTTLAPPAFTLLSPYDRVKNCCVCGCFVAQFFSFGPGFFRKKGARRRAGGGKKAAGQRIVLSPADFVGKKKGAGRIIVYEG
jgi:hypothetical protein